MGNPWAYDFSAIGRTAPLLIVHGSDVDPMGKRHGGFRVGGNSDVYKLLPETLAFEQVNLGQQFLKKSGRPDMARYKCILNLVTDPDQNPRALETLQKLLRGYRGRVINRPAAVLRTTRDQVAKRLAGIADLRVPKVIRLRNPKGGEASSAAQRAGMAYPIIARLAGTHTGRSSASSGLPASWTRPAPGWASSFLSNSSISAATTASIASAGCGHSAAPRSSATCWSPTLGMFMSASGHASCSTVPI
jgi:hypothetical protein